MPPIIKFKKKQNARFPIERFFEKYDPSYTNGMDEMAALRDVQDFFGLDTDIDTHFKAVMKQLYESGYDKCVDYMRGVATLNAIRQIISENPERYNHLDERDDLHERTLGVTVINPADPDSENGHFITFKTQIWALCLDDAPNSEKYAADHAEDIALFNITYGQILDYRKSKYPENSRDPVSDVLKNEFERKAQAAADQIRQSQKQLKRRPKL